MTSYTCAEFAATGIEMQIYEEEARREEALSHGWAELAAEHQREIARLHAELADLVEFSSAA